MIEKVRVSLWDIVTFFMTGLLVTLVAAVYSAHASPITSANFFANLSSIPTSISLVLGPLIITLVGMLIEPISNYADRYIFKHLLGWISTPRDSRREKEEAVLAAEIKEKYLGNLSTKVDNPFQICKDYVEHKQLSTSFMVFLARFGFYRNCVFICIATGIAYLFIAPTLVHASVGAALSILLAIIFRRRAQEFYQYQAGAIYRAFLIDKINWISRRESDLP